jgi:hypothetical protein
LTVNVRSPTAIVALRGFTSLFLSTENETTPLPVPGLPDVTASQPALLVADHWQVAGAVREKLLETLSLLKDALLGEISTAQRSDASSRTDTD